MKHLFLAVSLALSLGIAPAIAGEGTGEPFPNTATSFTARSDAATQRYADTGSSAYPSTVGRPGSNLPSLAGDLLPTNGSNAPVQTANSLPAHFEEGTVAYAQATSVRNWMVAHDARKAAAFASAARSHTPGG
jgi:hypothetical protein